MSDRAAIIALVCFVAVIAVWLLVPYITWLAAQ